MAARTVPALRQHHELNSQSSCHKSHKYHFSSKFTQQSSNLFRVRPNMYFLRQFRGIPSICQSMSLWYVFPLSFSVQDSPFTFQLPESPPYFFFTPSSKNEEHSSYNSETHISRPSYEVPQAPPTARTHSRPGGESYRSQSHRIPGESKVESLVTLRPAPPATQPTKDSQVEIVVPMTTSLSYSGTPRKPIAGRGPAPPETYMTAPQAPHPNLEPVATLPPDTTTHSSVTERLTISYMVEGK